jgi:hypothetical protein
LRGCRQPEGSSWAIQLEIKEMTDKIKKHFFFNNQPSDLRCSCIVPTFYTYQLSLNKEPKDNDMGPDFRDR